MNLKNFPHQFNDLGKLSTALAVIDNLNGRNLNVGDDGIYGAELATVGVYTFRNLITTISERLDIERQKSMANQGFRTAARDIRRFFYISGLIDGGNSLTAKGKEVVSSTVGSPLNLALWRDAMLQTLLVDDDGEASHPYRILLRLVDEFPAIETSKLLLALEAKNDSEAEFDRLRDLVGLPTVDIEIAIGITNTSARNAVKILPAIAEQVGDIVRKNGQVFPQSPYSANEDEFYLSKEYPQKLSKQSQPIDPSQIAKIPNFSTQENANFDLSAGIAIRKKRTIRHHETVVSLAKLLSEKEYEIFEHPYDCLGYKKQKGSILSEIKTLDGSRADERKQSIKALGQLRGYEYFNIDDGHKEPVLHEVIAFDAAPSHETIEFARHNSVTIAWLQNDYWSTTGSSGNTVNLDPDALLD